MRATQLQMLDALGVTVYRRTRRAAAVVSAPIKATDVGLSRFAPLENPVVPTPVARAKAPEIDRDAFEDARPTPVSVPMRPTPKVLAPRDASIRTEFVIAQAELARFESSKLYRHLCLCLAKGAQVPVVENAVLNDTALHFEVPPAQPLKLGSVALLRSAWRARRQAWQAIRIWRKQRR
jgi:phage tail protein X